MKRNHFVACLLLFSLVAPALANNPPTRRRAPSHAGRASAPAAPPASAGEAGTLPIRRVILYSNGVAYVERRGMVAGRAEVNLSFKQSQVDDVLKSLVVLDLGEGRIGAVSYNSSAPPSARMADIPFSISPSSGAGGGLAGVLSQLQGARVVVSHTKGTATGSILTIEERREQHAPDKPSVLRHALVIAADGGELMSFNLEDVRAVKLVEEGTRRDVSEFASATASTRRRDAKTITVTSDGAGQREMLISYTVAAPIWKTTYRVVLDDKGKPFFQGWAIVDNVSDEDWTDVRLSLISGTPISFIQPIQKPFYRYRPVVPIPNDLRLSPQVHDPDSGEVSGGFVGGNVADPNGATVPGATVTLTNTADNRTYNTITDSNGNFRTPAMPAGNYRLTVEAPGFSRYAIGNVAVGPARARNYNIRLNVGGVQESVEVTADADSPRITQNFIAELPLNGRGLSQLNLQPSLGTAITTSRSVETAAEGAEVGDLFEYQIAQPVTVRRDRSALIPILQTRMDGERVSIYNEAAHRARPMSGLLLKNSSGLTLEDGALTVIDGNAYAGEALLERLKPGEQRLVSFALDLGTLVTVRGGDDDDDDDDSPVYRVQIVNGALFAHYYQREKKVYTLMNQTDRPRVVYIEHPVREDKRLDPKETPVPEGKSPRYYRFRLELKPRETVQLPVVEIEDGINTFYLSNLTPDQLRLFIAERYIDEATRAALQHIVDLRARVAAADARIAFIDSEMTAISADQKRLRENIEALTKTTEARLLIARYVAKADQQETRIEQLTREKQEAAAERLRLQAELAAAVRALAIDRAL